MGLSLGGFPHEVDQFEATMQDNHIDYEQCFFNRSSGSTIEELNSCIAGFDYLISNVNDLYSRTDQYLRKALTNFNSCEVANSALGESSGEGT